jgi:hypothetical protein
MAQLAGHRVGSKEDMNRASWHSQLSLGFQGRVPRTARLVLVLVLVLAGERAELKTDNSRRQRENARTTVGLQQYIGWQTSFRALAS